jgi:signal transduction histidine kinase/ActR/RegA family two-component response regulator
MGGRGAKVSLDPLHHAREADTRRVHDVRDELVLVLAPTGRDGPLACNVLHDRAGLTTLTCPDVVDLCRQIGRGAGAVIVAEEAIDVWSARRLIDTLASQLPWSDLPVIILASSQEEMSNGVNGVPLAVLRQRGNVTVLDRPLRIVTLVTTVQAALRARRRQYEVRDLLAETRNAVRQRDQFLAMLGHELRNPLATISNAMSVLDAASPPDGLLENEQRDIIRRQTDHLARLVDDLLDVSRITSGKIALQRRPTDLCELAHRAAKAIDGAARKQRHEVIVLTHCDPVYIDADPVRMEQVVNNLLTNAIKYTPAGGQITVTVHPEDGHASLHVRDNGMGITPELLPRVFELFTQAECALDRSQGGLGIGLTLVRALVEMHDGHVTVTSDGPGRGSEFVITFPCVEAPPLAARLPKPVQPTAADGKGRRILVIEDQADARRALQRLLQIWGHHVDVAEDGVRGVDAAMSAPPEIALVDVGLPGLDGYEVARRIRTAMGKSIRLIALTGYGQPEDRERAFDAGFDMHLVKPVDRDQLAAALSTGAAASTATVNAAVVASQNGNGDGQHHSM